MSVRVGHGMQLVAVTAALLTAACGGGGGGNLDSAIPTTLSGPGGPAMVSSTGGIDTGYMGSVAAPAPASYGGSPAPSQLAIDNGAAFDGATGSHPNSTTFPVLFTALRFTIQPNGLAPVSADNGVTITVPGDQNAGYRLTVPLFVPGDCLCCDGTDAANLGLTNLNYVALGSWAVGNQSISAIQFLFGYETPARSMPATGQASFSGTATGDVYVPANGHILQSHLSGDAAISVDFASGNINGGFTNMRYVPSGGNGAAVPWNDVSVSASIAGGTSRFSGTTVVTSAPQNAMSLNSSATGSINGGFYGPAAQELGAIWTLNDGNASAIGGVLARGTH
jgi:C-lobe and N-lobe beta barrels of Tf-binding protein B